MLEFIFVHHNFYKTTIINYIGQQPPEPTNMFHILQHWKMQTEQLVTLQIHAIKIIFRSSHVDRSISKGQTF